MIQENDHVVSLMMINDCVRKKVSVLTIKLQSQKEIPCWAVASEMMIHAVAVGQKPPFGRYGKLIFLCIKWMNELQLADLVVFFVGFVRALSLWWKIGKNKDKKSISYLPKKIFMGFGACSEEYFYEKCKKSNVALIRIHCETGEGANQIGRPHLLSLLIMLCKLSFGHCQKLKNSIYEISSHLCEFLTVSALNIGIYTFYRQFWRIAQSQNASEVNFLASDVPLMACVDEGIRSIYIQHGLVAISMMIPQVHQINAITMFEKNYFEKYLKNTKVRINENICTDNRIKKNNVILIVFPKLLSRMHFQAIDSLIQKAFTLEFKIVFRPTMFVSLRELMLMKKQYPDVIIDDHLRFFDDSYRQWNPKILAAWSSTSLATALDRGTLPVNLHHPTDLFTQAVYVTVYPMYNRVMFWPRDTEIICETMLSEKEHQNQIMQLSGYQDLCLTKKTEELI
ncbi:MAG: hypothetical protein ACD_46C00708G0003 [uncultured bacterium]|nr:MAG: hypothetical protein ACD_46C00708G0003 [uncultured bacterium]OGT25425.1 MAG: hypothetical protein A3B71_05080 [Gammaproteobacteria bacterium RIFCSPHIGHO2_02_FULL_42_43]OGT28565.1 MAG: hypothetical protein A2624_04135 [Gammaproteobacteria bacterium RIFCSPHIGHO2_01_FULL_42_8]OGT51377.1 MAG: hypothetical protein A3E54_04845 [Gammaproteobacteria bacterium RIFCSPHIGHO2_12_FULL_41_25]OGT62079.1 MAG: hypothetical protein A3I77_03775 [Gammaproteobacteria bacterium RIFCSPLOWO2_02_FULL_42_14]OGT